MENPSSFAEGDTMRSVRQKNTNYHCRSVWATMLNPRPSRFGVILSGGQEYIQNRAPWPAVAHSNSRCLHCCQGYRGTALAHRPCSAEDSPEPEGRSLLYPRAEKTGESLMRNMFLKTVSSLSLPPALTVFCSASTTNTLGLSKCDVKKIPCARALVFPLLSAVLCQTKPTVIGLLTCSQYDPPQNLTTNNQLLLKAGQDRAEGKTPLKGVLWL